MGMSDLFNLYYQNYSVAVLDLDIANVKKYGDLMIDSLKDLDAILLTNIHWMLGDWIESARGQTNVTMDGNDTKNWYEFNARNQITLWGPTGQINNYACKQWGDVVGTYYLPQWQLFVEQVMDCMKNGTNWDQHSFEQMNFEHNELPWSSMIGGYHVEPVGDTIEIACSLYKKWNLNGDSVCN